MGGYKRDKMMEKKLGFISYNKSGWLTLKFEPANTLFNTLYGAGVVYLRELFLLA